VREQGEAAGVGVAVLHDGDLTLGFVSDIHVGPAALFEGKLRKLSATSLALLAEVVERMNAQGPDVLVNLGDDIEDESAALDVQRLTAVMREFSLFRGEVLHVAGNHDTVHVDANTLAQLWRLSGARSTPEQAPLYYAVHRKGFHLVVMHTHERKDERVFIDEAQFDWFVAELASSSEPKVVIMHHSAADQVLRGNRWFEKAPHLCLVAERKRIREILKAHDVRLVVNGHLHWNHLAVIDGVPYLTVQSLVENLDEDAPGRPARGHALVTLSRKRTLVSVLGEEPARYQFG
jgi:3',5'-cyclic-AMP phosphodiesterase